MFQQRFQFVGLNQVFVLRDGLLQRITSGLGAEQTFHRQVANAVLEKRETLKQHACHRFSDRPFAVTWLGLDMERERLGRRISERVDRMFRDGIVQEVRGLYRSGYGPELRCLQSIGYREVGQDLANRMTEVETGVAIKHATRRDAKRQRTWFRAEPCLEWIDAEARERAVQVGVKALG